MKKNVKRRATLALSLVLALLCSALLEPRAVPLFAANLGSTQPDMAGQSTPLVAFADPDNIFSLLYPTHFAVQEPIRYEDLAQGPLDGLLDQRGYIFGDETSQNWVAVFILMLDELIRTESDRQNFNDRLARSFGGDELAAVDMNARPGSNLRFLASTGVDIGDIHFSIAAKNPMDTEMVAVLLMSVERDRWDEIGPDALSTFESFEWSYDAALVAMAADIEMPVLERFHDPLGVFSVKVPAGWKITESSVSQDGYGYEFRSPLTGSWIGVNLFGAAHWLAAANRLATASQADSARTEKLRPINENEWQMLADGLVVELPEATELLSGSKLEVNDVRNDAQHTMHLVSKRHDLWQGRDIFSWWIEEKDGVVIAVSRFGDGTGRDVALLDALMESAITSLSWSPEQARHRLAENHRRKAVASHHRWGSI